VNVTYANAMAMWMGLPAPGLDPPTYGQEVISAADGTHQQLQAIYGIDSSDAYAKLGVITETGYYNGDRDNFLPSDAFAVRFQAVTHGWGELSFWSAGKDWLGVDSPTGVSPRGVFSLIFNGQ
jgi:hypothetical protein